MGIMVLKPGGWGGKASIAAGRPSHRTRTGLKEPVLGNPR